jgi:hypothetical protein
MMGENTNGFPIIWIFGPHDMEILFDYLIGLIPIVAR